MVSPHTYSIRIYILTRFSGDLHSLSSLSSRGSDTFLAPAQLRSIFFSLCCGFAVFTLSCSLKLSTLSGSGSVGRGPILSSVQFTAGIPGCWGCLRGGSGTKKADLAGSCSCQHLPEPAGKVIFGAQSPGVIGAFLCERAAQSLPWPSGATCPAQCLPAG